MRPSGPLANAAPAAPAETQPRSVRLQTRRIYILPTRYGLIFALTVFIMLVGSINYSNNLGHGVSFLLVGLALAAMVQTHQNLAGLQLRGARPGAVFAGSMAQFPIHLQAEGPDRTAVALQFPDGPPTVIDVAAGAGHDTRALVRRPAPERGRLRAGRMRVSTDYPLSLFRAWTWVELDSTCVVYPCPETADVAVPEPHPFDQGERSGAAVGQEDFKGLRLYRPGDSPRHVAWKQAASGGDPLTKQFDGSGTTEIWLDWDRLPGLEAERRLSRLCRWVLDCDARGSRYGLRIPGKVIVPDVGDLHKRRCLEALALLNLPTRRKGRR